MFTERLFMAAAAPRGVLRVDERDWTPSRGSRRSGDGRRQRQDAGYLFIYYFFFMGVDRWVAGKVGTKTLCEGRLLVYSCLAPVHGATFSYIYISLFYLILVIYNFCYLRR